jgi:phosphopantetheinyl transferase (holo-ACP synthase)
MLFLCHSKTQAFVPRWNLTNAMSRHLVAHRAQSFTDLRETVPFLSVKEKIFIGQIARKDRQYQWCSGRILAKYLFLKHLYQDEKDPADSLQHFTIGAIRVFPALTYTEIDLLTEDGKKGRPHVYWRGTKQQAGISLSYSDNYIAAVCSQNTAAGIDIEQIGERRAEFYAHSFTHSEQEYTNKLCKNYDQKVWLYTLLWTIKEAGLKASTDSSWNLWNLPAMDINLGGAEQEIMSLYQGKSSSIQIKARIKGTEGYVGAWLTVQQYNDRLVTIVHYE